jgi:hypothetical protein
MPAAEEADDLAVLGIRGQPVPEFRRLLAGFCVPFSAGWLIETSSF